MSKPKEEPLVTREFTRGRPRLIPNIEAVKRLGGQGLNVKQIALALGIDYHTLKKRRKESEEFDQAVLEGQSTAIANVTSALYKMATEDHYVAAAIFF
jgi:transposase-like protein